ncbi:MAG: hypothetical protein WC846_03270 [Candidatus Gracilibacteria bacterium]|jgi:hypothetical protein
MSTEAPDYEKLNPGTVVDVPMEPKQIILGIGGLTAPTNRLVGVTADPQGHLITSSIVSGGTALLSHVLVHQESMKNPKGCPKIVFGKTGEGMPISTSHYDCTRIRLSDGSTAWFIPTGDAYPGDGPKNLPEGVYLSLFLNKGRFQIKVPQREGMAVWLFPKELGIPKPEYKQLSLGLPWSRGFDLTSGISLSGR